MKTPAALVALALVVLAGCGGAASPSPSPTAGAASSPLAAAPSASVAGLPHDDPGLEARLPREVDGQALAIFSVGPISVAGNPGADPVKDLAKEIGDGTGDFGLAFANNPLAPSYNIFALRVPGAEAGELVTRYGQLTVADTTGAKAESVTIGGKETLHVTAPSNPIGDVWIYATGDTLFGVQAGSAERATALLALLP
jgi:hypothetical protein